MKEEEKRTKREPEIISDIEFDLIKSYLMRDRHSIKLLIDTVRNIISTIVLVLVILIGYELEHNSGLSLYIVLSALIGISLISCYEWYVLGKFNKTL